MSSDNNVKNISERRSTRSISRSLEQNYDKDDDGGDLSTSETRSAKSQNSATIESSSNSTLQSLGDALKDSSSDAYFGRRDDATMKGGDFKNGEWSGNDNPPPQDQTTTKSCSTCRTDSSHNSENVREARKYGEEAMKNEAETNSCVSASKSLTIIYMDGCPQQTDQRKQGNDNPSQEGVENTKRSEELSNGTIDELPTQRINGCSSFFLPRFDVNLRRSEWQELYLFPQPI